jgi:hypothetical protein
MKRNEHNIAETVMLAVLALVLSAAAVWIVSMDLRWVLIFAIGALAAFVAAK